MLFLGVNLLSREGDVEIKEIPVQELHATDKEKCIHHWVWKREKDKKVIPDPIDDRKFQE